MALTEPTILRTTVIWDDDLDTYRRWGWTLIALDPADERERDVWDVYHADATRGSPNH